MSNYKSIGLFLGSDEKKSKIAGPKIGEDLIKNISGWSLSASTSLEQPDFLSLSLGNIYSIDTKKIYEIDFGIGKKPHRFLVRDVLYGMYPSTIRYDITFSGINETINTVLPGGYTSDSTSIKTILKDIFSKAKIDISDIDIDSGSDIWPLKKGWVLRGDQYILDFLDDTFSLGNGESSVNMWIDSFGVFHMHPKNKGIETKTLSYDDAKKYLLEMSSRLERSTVTQATKTNAQEDTAGKKIETDRVLEVSTNIETGETVTKWKNKKTVTESTVANKKTTTKIITYPTSMSLVLAGIHPIDVHSSLELKGFPHGDGKYIVTGMTIENISMTTRTRLVLKGID